MPDQTPAEPTVEVTRYTVTSMPATATPDAYLWALRVEQKRDGTWSVSNGSEYLDTECGWHQTCHEAGTHSLDRALEIAKAVAPHLTINGMTAEEALARIARLDNE